MGAQGAACPGDPRVLGGSETSPSVQTPQEGRWAEGASNQGSRGRGHWKGIPREGDPRGGGPWVLLKEPAPCHELCWQALLPCCDPALEPGTPPRPCCPPGHCPRLLIRCSGMGPHPDASLITAALPAAGATSRLTPVGRAACLGTAINIYSRRVGRAERGVTATRPRPGEQGQGDGHNAWPEKFPVPREVGWCHGPPPDSQPHGNPWAVLWGA